MCSHFIKLQIMATESFKMYKKNLVIPNGSPANQAIAYDFQHITEAGYKGVAMGLVEIKNTNNDHFNFGLSIIEGIKTLDDVSKNFYQSTFQSPVNDRFLPIEFEIPETQKSRILITPTAQIGNADVIYQVVFKYVKK